MSLTTIIHGTPVKPIVRPSILLALILSLAGPAQAVDNTGDAQAAAVQWLALIDAGDYDESWKQSASLFQAALPNEQWDRTMQSIRSRLGATRMRTVKNLQYTRTLPGAPEGEYVVIQFQTDFANLSGATETVTPMKDQDGTWKVSGYFIK